MSDGHIPDAPRGLANSSWYASAVRATEEEVQEVAAHVALSALVAAVLRSAGGLTMVLNPYRQIVAGNDRLVELLDSHSGRTALGRRPGEVVGCVHVEDSPSGGCGTSEFCASCHCLRTIVASQESRTPQRSRCTLTRTVGGREVTAEHVVEAGTLALGDHDLTFLSFYAQGEEKAGGPSGRSYFHDLLETADALAQVTYRSADVADPVAFDNAIIALAERLALALLEQNEMSDLAEGRILPRMRAVSVDEMSKNLVHSAANAAVQGKILDIAPAPPYVALEGDPVLLLRALQHAIAWSIDHTVPGGTVRFWCDEEVDHVTFRVSRATTLSTDEAVGVFQRYFGASIAHNWQPSPEGRELIAEEYLGGMVTVRVTGWDGTTLLFEFPHQQ